ncbi:hypothetical protein GCM10028807_57870 [Spirosoma daeguense]
MASSVAIKGMSGLQRFLLNLAPSLKREIKVITETTGRNIEADAKRRAPVDTGKGRQSIRYEPTKGGLGASVSVNEPYMWYHEFGTGGAVEIPEGFDEFASGLRGKGERTINLPARPFLIPAFIVHREKYYKDVQDALDRLFR